MLSKVAPRSLRLAMSQAHEQPRLRLRQALASCEALLHPRTATQFPSRPAALADAAAAAAPAELYAWPSLAPAACSQPAAEGSLAAAAAPALPADADMTDAEPSEQPPPDPHVAQQTAPHTGISGEQAIPALQPLVPDAAAMTPAPAASVQIGASAAAASDLSPATAAAAAEPLLIQADPRAATAADTVAGAGAAASGPAAAAAAPLAAEQYSSDSEGSLPEIDSGGSDSDGE